MAEKEQAKPKPKIGRPKKHIDLELVEKLAHIQCTQAEIASALNVSVDTLARHPRFAEVYKRGSEGGRKSIRRMQFESANKGNIAMQIWLGKQYLGQSEHTVNEVRGVPMTLSELATRAREYLLQNPEIAERVKAIDADFVLDPEPARAPVPLPPPSVVQGNR
jgi:hypothetical protein